MTHINNQAAPTAHSMQDAHKLATIKLLHSAVWLFMATCVLLIPLTAFHNRFQLAAMLTAIILIECAVLAVNRGKCPLTTFAERYTEDRSDNFDIYLPRWLARYNKTIFGSLFICGIGFALFSWFTMK